LAWVERMRSDCLKIYRQLRGFLSRGVWETDIGDFPWFKTFLYRVARLLEHTARSFLEDQCFLRASALTYTSLLSLVPLLALVFSILKGLGVQRNLEPLILERFTLGSKEVAARILEYIDRTNVSSLGALGVVALLVTAVMVLKNMERAFNWIWKVERGRSWARVLSDYLSILMVIPFCILLALSLTTYFNSSAFLLRMKDLWIVGGIYRMAIKMAPFVVLWIAFTFCYLFLPNTRVKFVSALVGGMVGGTLWQLAQWSYVRYQVGVAKYNAIYGALSQLPILLVWIYISWVILLLGAEIAHAHQSLEHYSERRAQALRQEPPRIQQLFQILTLVGERFLRGAPPFTAEELGEHLQISPSSLHGYLSHLESLGWIAPWEDDSAYVLFQRPPEQMPLHRLFEAEWAGDEEGSGSLEPSMKMIFEKAREGIRGALAHVTVMDLLSQKGEDARPPSDASNGLPR